MSPATRRRAWVVAGAAGVAVAVGVGLLVWRPWQDRRDPLAALRRPAPDSTTAPPGTVRQAAAPAHPDSLPAVLRDSGWSQRLAYTQALAGRDDLPPPRRAQLVLAALDREVDRPSTGVRPPGSYLTVTELARIHYVRMIAPLGPDAAAEVRKAQRSKSGPAAEWRALALGATGDPAAVAPLRQLLRGSQAGAVRMAAAYYLGLIGDRAAIPELRAALSDPFTADIIPDRLSQPARTFYPVREQAAAALRRLGVAVRGDGTTYTVGAR